MISQRHSAPTPTPTAGRMPFAVWGSPGMRGLSGLNGQLSDVLVGTGIQAGTAIGGAAASSAILGSGGLAAAGIGAASLAALATAGIAAAGMAIGYWISSMKRNGMNKENATAVANKAESLLQENMSAWNASSKTVEDREVALANAQAIINYMLGPTGCGNQALGDPGKRCISERLVEGAVWPWLDWYVKPISNFTPTVSNAEAIQAETGGTTGASPLVTRTAVVDPATGQTQYVETVAAPSVAAAAGGSGSILLLGAGALLLIAFAGSN